MKLAPVLTELVKPIPGVEVVQSGITVENIAIAVPLGDQGLLAASPSRRPNSRTTAPCRKSAANGSAIRTPTSASALH